MRLLREVSPTSVSWRLLTCRVHQLSAGETINLVSDIDETLLVLVAGSIHATGSDVDEKLNRPSPFSDLAAVVYLPPGTPVAVHALADSEFAIGSAPAEGRHPVRVVQPEEMASEVRGGANATRQVVTTYGPEVPAERLISYEAWVPRGSWTGWPPHRHDGRDGSPYLEETYYYRFDRPEAFGIHRNFDRARGLNEVVPIEDRSLVPVPAGYHLCAAGPSSNAWILNFLAGTPEDRHRAPVFDPDEAWITDDWSAGALSLPAVHPEAHTADAEPSEGHPR